MLERSTGPLFESRLLFMAGQQSHPHDPRCPEAIADNEPSSTIHPASRPELQDTVIRETADFDQAASGDTSLPAAFGRYRVVRLLGRGGMGSVYLGHDDELDRAVAIKVPHPRWFATDEGRAAFLQEARTLARLEHPRIIPVYDAGQTAEGTCFVVFKFVDSQTLAEYTHGRRLPPGEAADILAEVAGALHHAHKLGFVHRDIKPSNILIDRDGNAWVADFGLAVAESTQRQLAGEVSGTPAYMSPEQIRGAAHHLDGRTDIWSLGVILYELIAARRPFAGDDAQALFAEIAQKEPRPPRMIDETIPPELERIAIKCLRKDVAERYTSAHDLARDLKNWDRNGTGAPFVIGGVVGGVALLGLVAALALRNTGPTDNDHPLRPATTTSAETDNSAQSTELALLIEEMRGLRRDLGEAPPGLNEPVAAAASAVSPHPKSISGTRVDSVDLLPGEWAPIPLPAGFSDFDEKLRATRDAGDEDAEERLLLNATNKLIEAGHFAIAEHLAHRMVELAGNDESDVPFAYGQLGLAQYRLGKHSAALTSYQRAGEVYQKLYDRMMSLPESEQVLKYRAHLARLWGITFMRMGNVHKAADDYQLAQIHYEKARKLFEVHDRPKELATLLLNFGSLEARRGNYERAVSLLQQGLAVTQLSNDDEAELRVNLGNAYSRRGDNKLALEQYELAYNLMTADASYTLRSALLGNYATSLLEEGRNDEALPLLGELKSIARPEDADSRRVLEFLRVLEGESGAATT
jgi:serine/threonine protein kinase/tetratricopeptide (TPR) repeat protein